MKRQFTSFFATVILGTGMASAETHKALTLASEVFAEYPPALEDHSPKAMAEAAKAFLATLGPEGRKQAALPFDDPERSKWTNVPTSADDGGIRLGDLTRPQLESARTFLATVMSSSGYLKCRNIMMADDLLLKSKEQAERRGGFGTANFWIAIFGTPSETEPWAVQWDGHHVAINLTIKGEQVSMSPSFIGTQPSAFKLGEEEIVPMKNEVAFAFEFIKSLDDEQMKKAVQGDKRGNLRAGAGKDGYRPEAVGLSCGTLTGDQKKILMRLIGLWVNDLPEAAAKVRLKEIEDGLDKTHFSWNGPHAPGSDASYHIYGPALIIEFSGQDLGGDPHNHLHSIYRHPGNEYGSLWQKSE